MRRLFHQHQRVERVPPAVFGRDLGFTGLAADVQITDEYQCDRLAQETSSDGRLRIAHGYLLKILKHAKTAAEQRNDVETLATLDDVRGRLAESTLALTERVKSELLDRGYGAWDQDTAAFEYCPPAERTPSLPTGQPEVRRPN